MLIDDERNQVGTGEMDNQYYRTESRIRRTIKELREVLYEE